MEPKTESQYRDQVESAHESLDLLGVPRRDYLDQVLTLSGRIDWLREALPKLSAHIELVCVARSGGG